MHHPVRWGFLGAGWIASRAVGPATHDADGATLYAAAARDPERARGLGVERVHATYDDLLDDDAVDAVYISLANDAHRPWVDAALQAGKHVLCEKPLGLTAAEVTAMAEAADRAGRLLVEASMWQWHPRTARLRELLGAGAIGPVRHVEAGFTFTGELAGNYRLEPDRGGGALYDVGCYGLSAVALAVLDDPDDVAARAELGPTGVDLDVEAVLGWGDGASARVRAGMAGPDGQWLVVSGEHGEIELRAPVFTAWREDRAELLLSDGRSTAREAFDPVDPYRLMVEAVSARISGDTTAWVVPPETSARVAALIDRVRAAADLSTA